MLSLTIIFEASAKIQTLCDKIIVKFANSAYTTGDCNRSAISNLNLKMFCKIHSFYLPIQCPHSVAYLF